MMGYPRLSGNALKILRRRYLKKDEHGNVIETPDEMFQRVAENIAAASAPYGDRDSEEKQFYTAMRSLKFLPNSPTLMNAGTGIQQLAACFVLPVEDSIEGIYDAVKYAAIIHQSGGGTGFSFSRLRPAGDIVGSTGGVASGPVSFMKVFDAATEAIKQGGRRRGASMGVLKVDHPDIISFIRAKEDLRSLSNFNISVAVTDDFIQKVREEETYDLINPRTGEIWGRESARKVLAEAAEMATRTGDPGLLFLDEVNRKNPTPHLGEIEATNPCGEVPLLPYEACNLGSINLSPLVKEGELEWDQLADLVGLGVRFLDNVIDAGRYPLPEIEKIVKGNRKIGLGVMGFADALIKMGIGYGDPESIDFARNLIRFIWARAEKESRQIAASRGSFPNIDGSRVHPPRRNATLLSIAPTGTISMIADCSSGVEPHYAISYTKHVMEDEHVTYTHPLFLRMAKERGFYSPALMSKITRVHSIQDMDEVPSDLKRLFVTAHDVPPFNQLMIQAAFQETVDNAVSKTINLPYSSTPSDVEEIFLRAHELGCKGITVYREGSKPEQVLTIAETRVCPECGSQITAEEGSFACKVCGYS